MTVTQGPYAPLAVALVGAGEQGARVLLPALRTLEDIDVLAVCDTALPRARSVARHAGIPNAFGGVEEALARLPLDALVVACSPAAHASTLELALSAGTAVFVEKPPAASTIELASLARRAAAAGAITGVGMNFRYATAIEQVLGLVADARSGNIVSLSMRHMASKPRDSLWGESVLRSMLLSQVVHPVDLALHVAGEVATVSAQGAGRGGEITLVTTLTHRTGTVTSIVASTAAPRFHFTLTATTDQGVVVECRDLWQVSVQGSPAPAAERAWAQQWSAGALDRGYARSGYERELASFFQSVAERRRFSPDLSDLLPTYRVLDEVDEALDGA